MTGADLSDQSAFDIEAMLREHRADQEARIRGWRSLLEETYRRDLPKDELVTRLVETINPSFDHPAPLRRALLAFYDDNSTKTPDELAAIASDLYDGRSFHRVGEIVNMVRDVVPDPCRWLLAAAVYEWWKGGKAGFMFLPDPAVTDPDEYYEDVQELLSDIFDDSWFDGGWSPRHVLTDVAGDLKFYEALPERMTIHRGGAGLSHERLSFGVCWTLSRPIAEWFAMRAVDRRHREPVVVSARIPKSAVLLVFNSEMEIVAWPMRWRPIKCRRRVFGGKKPVMSWTEMQNPPPAGYRRLP